MSSAHACYSTAAPRAFPLAAAVIVACGVILRGAFLVAAEPLELHADEANYVYLALSWNHFGFYSDSYRYLWPPGYTFVLATAFDLLGSSGIYAVKLLQVVASTSIGMTTAMLAGRLFGGRAAILGAGLWAVYLPLIGFTHLLWSETLFLSLLLPAILLVLAVMQDGPRRATARILAAGALLGGALYFKEVALWLVPVLAALLALFAPPRASREGPWRASLLLLAVAVVVVPWTLRNWEVYGRLVTVGASLGENAYHGLNAHYTNWDTQPFVMNFAGDGTTKIATREWWVRAEPSSGWNRANEIFNTPDRLSENLRRGLGYAWDHPGWLLRSRIKKLADLLAPMSFFVRHQAMGFYDGSVLGRPYLRPVLVAWAVACPMLVLLLGAPGYFVALEDRAGRWLVGGVVLYFLATSLLAAMSRFRAPIEPLLIVLAAGMLSRSGAGRAGLRGWCAAGACLAALVFLWWIDLPEVTTLVQEAWSSAT